jgi:hypothetical protein
MNEKLATVTEVPSTPPEELAVPERVSEFAFPSGSANPVAPRGDVPDRDLSRRLPKKGKSDGRNPESGPAGP